LSAEKEQCCSWSEYEKEFPFFSDQTLRPGCHPRKLLQTKQTGKAIVLVHGLTDSPFYMLAIAKYFHNFLGYNVFMPLLQRHGMKHPEGMAGVTLEQWNKNVAFAIRAAAETADRVSVGGLSTGGALSLYLGGTDSTVTGDVYLFSAALGLYGGPFGFMGDLVEILLRRTVVRYLDNGKHLVGNHPYRYDRVPLNSAAELSRLILKIDGMLKNPSGAIRKKRIFAAWSECDRVVSVRKLNQLKNIINKNQFFSFVVPQKKQVDHACVVLDQPIYATGSHPGDAPLEKANPSFAEMMTALSKFESAI